MIQHLKRELQIAMMHLCEALGLVTRSRVPVRPTERPVDRQIRTRR